MLGGGDPFERILTGLAFSGGGEPFFVDGTVQGYSVGSHEEYTWLDIVGSGILLIVNDSANESSFRRVRYQIDGGPIFELMASVSHPLNIPFKTSCKVTSEVESDIYHQAFALLGDPFGSILDMTPVSSFITTDPGGTTRVDVTGRGILLNAGAWGSGYSTGPVYVQIDNGPFMATSGAAINRGVNQGYVYKLGQLSLIPFRSRLVIKSSGGRYCFILE